MKVISVFLLLLASLFAQEPKAKDYTPCDFAFKIMKQFILNGPKDVSCGSWVLAFTEEYSMGGDMSAARWTVVASTYDEKNSQDFPKRTYHISAYNSGGMGDGWNPETLEYKVTGFDEQVEQFKKNHPDCKKFPCKWKSENCEGEVDSASGWGMSSCHLELEPKPPDPDGNR